MAIPMKQAAAVGKYILTQKLKGRKRYPLVTMLEPLFRCNLECVGCGKIQYPEEILKQSLTPEKCFWAVEECGAPVVTIAGGEPLIHLQIKEIVDGLVERGKFVYLCTNALLLRRKMDLFKPSDQLTLSIHLDGVQKHHDACVQREGVYETAVAAIKEAKQRGFRVTTNTTIFEGHPAADLHRFFDDMTALRRRRHDDLARLQLREVRPMQDKFLKKQSDGGAVPRGAGTGAGAQAGPSTTRPSISTSSKVRTRVRVHAVGQSRTTRSSAGSVLAICSTKVRLRRDLQGADGDDGVGEVRHLQRPLVSAAIAWSTAATSRPPSQDSMASAEEHLPLDLRPPSTDSFS